MRVLLIENDAATSQSIELMLQSDGFNCYSTDLGSEGIELGKLYDYDIILLGDGLPDISGIDVIENLRSGEVTTPVLILSHLADVEDKVHGLDFGADDYITKPFHKDELVARIHAIVRRSKGHVQSVVKTGEVKVHLDTKTVEVNGNRLRLTSKEYQMLELLSLRKGTTITKEILLNHLYGGIDEPDLKIIDVFITKLRKKLSIATGGNSYIETVWGRGYVLRDPEIDSQDTRLVSDDDHVIEFKQNSIITSAVKDSQVKLQELRESLNGVVPSDSEETTGNRSVVPFTNQQLSLLIATVDAAIAFHGVDSWNNKVVKTLRGMTEILEELEKMGPQFHKTAGAWLPIKKLLKSVIGRLRAALAAFVDPPT